MESITNRLNQGDFTLLRVLSNGAMTDILTLMGSGGSGAVTSATAALSISGSGVLSIDGTGYLATTHEAGKINRQCGRGVRGLRREYPDFNPEPLQWCDYSALN